MSRLGAAAHVPEAWGCRTPKHGVYIVTLTRVLEETASITTLVLQNCVDELHTRYGLAGVADTFLTAGAGTPHRSLTNVGGSVDNLNQCVRDDDDHI